MPLFIFPTHLFNPTSVKAKPRARVIDGGTSLVGVQDVISADGGGRWFVDYNGIVLNTPQKERWWTQWNSYMNGGARVFLVPALSLRTAPRPPGATPGLAANDPVFPTAVGYSPPYITATVAAPVAVGDTTAVINMATGAALEGGETFSVGYRAYTIERVIAVAGSDYTCIVNPPVRAAISAGASANFEWPVVQCRMVVGQDIIPDMNFGFGTVSISFAEDFSNVV